MQTALQFYTCYKYMAELHYKKATVYAAKCTEMYPVKY